MKTYTRKQLSYALSLYLDGALSETEHRELEEYISAHPDAQQELNELRNLQRLFSERPKLKESPAFWTKLSAALKHPQAETETLLPFPRKFVPAVAMAGLVVLVLGGVFLFQNRDQLGEYLSEKSKIVKDVYDQGVLKSSILPLFSNIDKNQVLQFSLLGTLSLDSKQESSLRVDEEAEKGYRIEFGKGKTKQTKPVTVQSFKEEVQLTSNQEKVIDSMLAVMKNRIEASVLVTEHDALVIDPELSKLNRVMVSNIAASLEPPQRVRFNRFLETRDAPYVVSVQQVRRDSRERTRQTLVNIHKAHGFQQFLVVTADTVVYARVDVNIDSIRNEFEAKFRHTPPTMLRADRVMRMLRDRELAAFPRTQTLPRSLQVYGDSQTFSIEIEKEMVAPEVNGHPIDVLPRMRAAARSRPSMRGFGFQFVSPGAGESLSVKFFDESGTAFDSMAPLPSQRYQKKYGPKLDSMMKAMDEKRMKEEAGIRRDRSRRQEE